MDLGHVRPKIKLESVEAQEDVPKGQKSRKRRDGGKLRTSEVQ